jgi:hypothetical protein
LIIGPGGVGKTTLGKVFAKEKEPDDPATAEYVESISTETYSLGDDPRVQIVVPPGQPHRADATWDTVLSDLRNGKFRGIILTLAYGHHSLGDISYKHHRLYSKTKGLKGFVKDYINECLTTEDEMLARICDAIGGCDKPVWFLTLVTKEDLWWKDRAAVQQHYTSGSYGSIIARCMGRKNTSTFRHEQVFVSLLIRNLVTGRGEVLKNTTAGYDLAMQEQSFEKLLQVFNGLMEWEQQHGLST